MKDYILNSPPKVLLQDNFATNINPLGPPKWVLKYIKENCKDVLLYPELWHQECDKRLAEELGVDPNCHLTIPGTSEFFWNLHILFNLQENRIMKQKWASFSPTFWEYSLAAKMNDIEFHEFPIDPIKQDSFFNIDNFFIFLDKNNPALLFLCLPNNPTGHVLPLDFLIGLADRYPNMQIIIDLTYAFFEDNFYEYLSLILKQSKNITAVISYSKFFCLPGLRIGSVIFSSANNAERYRKLSGPLRLNIFSERLLPKLLADQKYITRTKKFFRKEWKIFIKKMQEYDLKWISTMNNTSCFRMFFLRSPDSYPKCLNDSSFITEKLYSNYGIRVCDGRFYGINNAIRIRVGRRKSNLKLIEALKSLENIDL